MGLEPETVPGTCDKKLKCEHGTLRHAVTFSVNCLMTEGGRGGRGKASMGEGSEGPGIITNDDTFSSALCDATNAARRLKPAV